MKPFPFDQRKKFIFLIFIISLLTPLSLKAASPPQFKDYPVTETYKGPNAPADLSSPEARQYRTRLKEAAKEKPNFAGHYIVTYWGCGTGCIFPAIINTKTGKIFMLPFSVVSYPGSSKGSEEDDRLQFKLDSKLLIIHGALNEAEKEGTYYYKWENEKLVTMQSVKK